MTQQTHNPFQGIDIRVHVSDHNQYTRYCRRGDGVAQIDDRPFSRMVDLWFFAVCVAVRLGLNPKEISGRTKKIIEGSILGRDPWRIHFLLLIAIARTKDVKIVSEPTRIINLANELAAAGLPKVVDMIREGSAEEIWNLSDSIVQLLQESEEYQ